MQVGHTEIKGKNGCPLQEFTAQRTGNAQAPTVRECRVEWAEGHDGV